MEQISNQLEQISQSIVKRQEISQEQATAGLLQRQTSEKFTLAISRPKIKDLTNIEPLKEALRVAMIIVGLRGQNFPNEMEKSLLLSHIVKYYGGHTPEEIRLAFEMAVCSQLELSFDEVTSYENFSILYFSRIMTAYRNWAEVEYRQSVKEEPTQQTICTQEDLDNIHRGDVENFYQRCLNGVVPYKTPEYLKEILVKDGLMKPDESLSRFIIQKMGSGVKNIYVK